MKVRFLIPPLLILSLLPVIAQSAPDEIEQPEAASYLPGHSWQLVEILSMDGTVKKPDDRSLYTVDFKTDGTVQIRADCNRGRGGWTSSSPGTLEFTQIAATLAMCPPDSLHDPFMALFPYVRSYVVKSGHLFLATMADGSITEFEPVAGDVEAISEAQPAEAAPAAPEDGGPLNWEVISEGVLRMRGEPSTSAEVVSTLNKGTILDNLGCQQAEGRAWCYVQPFGGGPVGFVASEFLQPAVGPDGAVATGPDNSAQRAGQGDFDATGKIPCVQTEGQPMGQCDFGVARHGGGFASVVVTKGDGMKRTLFFRRGVATGADTSEADGYHEFSGAIEGGLYMIRVGPERYEIPEAVIFGG